MSRAWWRERWQRRRQDVAVCGFITIFFLLFFYPVFISNKFFIINDAFVYSYPLRMTAWAAIRNGNWPLWTPLLMSGYPLLSMSHIGLAYPLTWGYLFLPGHWAEQIYILAPYLLTPIFVYAYAREINRSRMASMLAGLSFGYGGMMVSAVANSGLWANALMWLPLFLIAIERARTRPFIRCLLGAVAAYGMCVLSGVAQGFVIVGVLAIAYAGFVTGAANLLRGENGQPDLKLTAWERWRPLVVAVAAALMSAGLAAFQILETMRAVRRSVRSTLSYEVFTEGSYTFLQACKTFLLPLHYIIHATTYVSPLSFALAVLAVICAIKHRRCDARIFFWLGVAVVAFVMMMGANTPLYRVLYRIPVLNSFRVPPRHAFEWSFALSILAAYGWDAVAPFFSRAGSARSHLQRSKIVTALCLLVLGTVVFLLWLRAANQSPALWDEPNHYPQFFPEPQYLLWKLLSALLVFAAVWLGWRIVAFRWRVGLLAGAIALGCFVEPAVMASRWWWPALKTAERFTVASPVTKFMQGQAPDEQRVYTRTALWAHEMQEQPSVDSANLTMLYGLRNTGGYEQLMTERYSRALGNVGMDAATPRLGLPPDPTLFEPQSQVLDLLNTTFVVSYLYLATEQTPALEKEGIRFHARDLARELKPGEKSDVAGAARECDTLSIVSSLANSISEADGATVAKLRLVASDGRVIERELRAGTDTAEWAHERPDVKARIRHPLAPIFDSIPGDESNSFNTNRYWTRIPLGQRVRVERIEISNVSPRATFGLWKMTLYDSATQFSMPLPHYDLNRWEPAYERDGVEILRNKRALPRVWLVAEAESVDGEEALSRIRGESSQSFDPHRTALLEISQNELPHLPGGTISTDSSAHLTTAEANRLVIETNSAAPSVLVVSEANYPGWAATVDGQPAPIHTADFLLRGIALPAGAHRVEMRYTAPGARTGAIISLLTLLLIIGLWGYERVQVSRRRRHMLGLPRQAEDRA